MFKGHPGFNYDIFSKWADMTDMFYLASSFNSNISNMKGMFADASCFNSDISKWDVSSFTNMRLIFKGASGFKQNLCPRGPKLRLPL